MEFDGLLVEFDGLLVEFDGLFKFCIISVFSILLILMHGFFLFK
jgi:hypothetical protein